MRGNVRLPKDAQEYVYIHGPHFSKKLCEYAIGQMRNSQGNKHFNAQEVEELLKRNKVEFDENDVYDAVYAFNMLYSDFFPKAIKDEQSLAEGVKCLLEDTDGYDGMIFTRWYADCLAKGTPIRLERFL